jgi:hypothetical protein
MMAYLSLTPSELSSGKPQSEAEYTTAINRQKSVQRILAKPGVSIHDLYVHSAGAGTGGVG